MKTVLFSWYNVNEELKQVKELLKEKYKEDFQKILIGVELENFNPITHEEDNNFEYIRVNNDFDGEENFENGKTSDPIKAIIDYMKINNRINDNIKNSFKENVKVGNRAM